MKILDCVYGETEINEKIIIELVNTKEMQRLKGISQFGIPNKYYHKNGFSRYDHSIGTFLLLRRLRASLKEQIAGLLHDVSHTAFSHVIDWVVGDPSKEDYQDNRHLKFIKISSIARILEKNNFKVEEIADLHGFHLLDFPAPDLCADRIDYTLREIALESNDKIKDILDSLKIFNEQIFFEDEKPAFLFSNEYAKLNREHWAGSEAKTRYHILANILKKALSEELLSLKDIEEKEDIEILNLLEEFGSEEIKRDLNILRKGFKIVKSANQRSFFLRKKFRFVDPFIINKGRLSEINNEYRELLIHDRELTKEECIEIVA